MPIPILVSLILEKVINSNSGLQETLAAKPCCEHQQSKPNEIVMPVRSKLATLRRLLSPYLMRCRNDRWFTEHPQRKKSMLMMMLIAAFFLLTFSLYIAKSQAAFLGFFVSLLFILFYFLRDKMKAKRKTILLIFSFIFLIMTFLLPSAVSELEKNIRFPLYTGAIRMIKSAPLLGFGPGKFETSFQKFRPKEYFGREETVPISNHAHNEYLEMAAETGLPSLVFFILFIAAFFFLLNRRLAHNKTGWYILAGLGAGILAVLIDNLFSTNMRTYSVLPFFYLALGMASGFLPGIKKMSKLLSYVIPIFLSAVILIFIPFSFREVKSQIYYKKAAACIKRGELNPAIDFLETSLKYSPYNLNTFYKLGYLYAIANKPLKSLFIYNELLKLSPNFAHVHYNIAVMLACLGEKENALSHLRQALKENPYDEKSLSLFTALRKKGESESLVNFFEKRVDREKLQLYNSQK